MGSKIDSKLIRVTFDTNTLVGVVEPAGQPDSEACTFIHQALRRGLIKGYFAEAVAALDGLGRRDKAGVVGSARIVSKASTTGTGSISISIGAKCERTPIDPRFRQMLEAALDLGLRALLGPRRFLDSLAVSGFGDHFYEPYSDAAELVARGEKANKVDAALAKRGLGRARAVELGGQWNEQAGEPGKRWPEGLDRASNDTERKKVLAVVREWADGDAIAAHIGHGNDFFCTHDQGSDAGQRSALHPGNRSWLAAEFGARFVTRMELAQELKALGMQ